MRGTQAMGTHDDLFGLGLVQRNYLAFAVKSTFEEPVFRDNRMYLTRNSGRGAAWGRIPVVRERGSWRGELL